MDSSHTIHFMKEIRWFCIALLLPIPVHADDLENRMQRCQWDLQADYLPVFQEARKRLPPEIRIVLKSCAAGGPSYQLQAQRRMVELQDGWLDGDRSTAYFFSSKQAAPDFWTFDYRGYEWSGVTFVNKRTGEGSDTPCNSVSAMHYNPRGDRLVFMCSPEYGGEREELHAGVLSGKPKFLRLNAKPPKGDISVVWKSDTLARVEFRVPGQRTFVREYRIPH